MYKIQEELKEWAEETYNFYLPLASKLNMDFYTQSKLTDITDDKPVELMVIGINPGHGGTFLKDRFEKSGAPDKPCGVGRADANPKLLLNDT